MKTCIVTYCHARQTVTLSICPSHSWTVLCENGSVYSQGDHSTNNVKFPQGGSRLSSTALGMLSVTHIMPALVLNMCMDANMQLAMNSFRQLFPDKIFSVIFSKIPDISLTAAKFPDISRFSTQVVTLHSIDE